MKKNILFLLSLFIAPLNAMPIGEKINQTKSEWRKCQKSFFRLECIGERKAYRDAKQELTDNFISIIQEEEAKYTEFVVSRMLKTNIIAMPTP